MAVSDFTKSLEIAPNFAEAYYNRALTYFFKGEYDNSWIDVMKAQKLGYQIPSQFLQDLCKASGTKM